MINIDITSYNMDMSKNGLRLCIVYSYCVNNIVSIILKDMRKCLRWYYFKQKLIIYIYLYSQLKIYVNVSK